MLDLNVKKKGNIQRGGKISLTHFDSCSQTGEKRHHVMGLNATEPILKKLKFVIKTKYPFRGKKPLHVIRNRSILISIKFKV